MTDIGAGGVVIERWSKSKRFHRDYDDLDIALKDVTDQKLQDLTKNPRPPGLRFEKLKGYDNPNIYTIHINGNYKLSMEIKASNAFLRRVGCHNEIDRLP